MSNPRPTELEMQVLTVLWETGPVTVRQLLDQLPDGKQRAYTTVLTVVQLMEKKKLLTRSRGEGGVAHVYAPAVTRQQVVKPMLRGLVERVFGGSATAAVQHLLSDASVGRDELRQIREMIDAMDDKRPRSGGGGRSSRTGE